MVEAADPADTTMKPVLKFSAIAKKAVDLAK